MTEALTGWIGYIDEVTYGTSPIVAGSKLRAFGIHLDPLELPKQKSKIIRRDISSTYTANALLYGQTEHKITIPYVLMDGRELYYHMGKTPDTAGSYTHTLTSMVKSDGAVPPSRTLRIETDGLTTDKRIDVRGCLPESLTLDWESTVPTVNCKEELVFKNLNDESTGENATTTLTTYAGQAYLRAPSGTEYSGEDAFYCKTVSVGENDITDAVTKGSIKIAHAYTAYYANNSDTDEFGVQKDRCPYQYFLQHKDFDVLLECYPTDEVLNIWDIFQNQSATTTVVITFARYSDTTNETIVFTFDNDETPIYDVSGMLKPLLDDPNNLIFRFKPKDITSIVYNTTTNATLLADA